MPPHIVIPDADGRRRSRQFRIRTLMLVIVVAASWCAALRVPEVRLLVGGLLGGLMLGVVVLLAGVGVAVLGGALCLGCERVAARAAALARWPRDEGG